MKILFSIAGLEFGGSEVFILRITKKLSESHRIVLINTHPDVCNKQLIHAGLGEKVTLVNAPSRGILKKLPFFDRIDKIFSLGYKIDACYLRLLIWYYGIQMVCSFKYESDAFICSALKNTSIPVVISTRGCYSLMKEKVASSMQDSAYFINQVKQIFEKAGGLIWLTQKNIDVLEELEANVPAKNIQIYNGFPSTKITHSISRDSLGVPADAIVFGMVARGIKEKGWEIAIEAFLLNKTRAANNSRLILIGDSSYVQSLKEKYAYEQNIVFIGQIDKPVNYIPLFDVALLPTWFEGESIPNSVVEYLYCGKPVIATDWVEIPEMISIDGYTAGFIIPLTSDQVPDHIKLADYMLKYIENDVLLKDHTVLAEKAFNKFSMDICVDKYSSFFKSIIHEGRSY